METGHSKRHQELPSQFLNFLWGMETSSAEKVWLSSTTFLNFLWGMETRKFSGTGGRYLIVFELPMRDGNRSWIRSRQWQLWVFELPMRDGNRKDSKKRESQRSCFWTSYEGWKLHTVIQEEIGRDPFLNFLWGMETLFGKVRVEHPERFWTSYEGWKHASDPIPRIYGTVFLNFLWGMETRFRSYPSHIWHCVFELPMRDGNSRSTCHN